MLFQGQEFAASRAVPVLRRPRAGARRRSVRKGRASSCRSSRASPRPRCTTRAAGPVRPGDVRAVQARLRRARDGTTHRCACTATCCGCAATTRRSAAQRRAASTARCSGREAFVAALLRAAPRTAATTACCSSTSARDLDLARRPSRCWRRPPARRWRVAVVERDPRYGGPGTPPLETRAQLAHPRPRGRRARPDARGRAYDPACGAGEDDRGSGVAPGGAAAPGDRASAGSRARSLSSGGSRCASGGRPRVAGHQRPGRLRLGHGLGRATRRYHGLLVAALPAPLGPHDDAQPPLRAAPAAGRHALRARRPGARGQRARAGRAPSTSPSSGSRPACRSGGTSSTARRSRSASLLPHQQNTVHVTYRLVARRAARPAQAASGAPLPAARGIRPRRARRAATRSPPSRTPTSCPPRAAIRRCACKVYGRARRVHARQRQRVDRCPLPRRGERGYERAASCGAPGTSASDLTADTSATLVASTEAWDTIGALSPEQALPAERERRERLARAPRPAAARSGIGAELVLAADQFIITPAGRVEDAARARAAGDEVRTVIAGYHWFTDWGRDTMISLEGLTLHDGPPRRGGLHPAHVRPLRARRPHPQHVPRRRERGPLPHGRRDALVLPRRRPLPRGDGRPRDARGAPAEARDIVAYHLEGTRFGIRVDPEDGLLARARRAISSPGWTRRCDDWVVTPRRGKAVEINALWYNALRLLEGWTREERGRRRPPQPFADARRAVPRGRSTSASGTRTAATSTTSSKRGRPADDTACRPNQLFAISLDASRARRGALGRRGRRRARASC